MLTNEAHMQEEKMAPGVDREDNHYNPMAFEGSHSPIFAPFMINVVCILINQEAGHSRKRPDVEVSNWCGGLSKITERCPEWSTWVFEATRTIQADNPFWIECLREHRHTNASRLSPLQRLECLLQAWTRQSLSSAVERTPGPYPTAQEQNVFFDRVQNVHGRLCEQIARDRFKGLYEAAIPRPPPRQRPMPPSNSLNTTFDSNMNHIHNIQLHNRHNETGTRVSMQVQTGKLYYQTGYFTNDQFVAIQTRYRKDTTKAPWFLFGDNDTDKYRYPTNSRSHFGGQAEVAGKYDRSIAMGITTTFFEQRDRPNPTEYQRIMDKEFQIVMNHIRQGYDVIIPAPPDTNQQEIKHNLGRGIADLPLRYLRIIQTKIDQLSNIAANTQSIGIYQSNPPAVNPAAANHALGLTPRRNRNAMYDASAIRSVTSPRRPRAIGLNNNRSSRAQTLSPDPRIRSRQVARQHQTSAQWGGYTSPVYNSPPLPTQTQTDPRIARAARGGRRHGCLFMQSHNYTREQFNQVNRYFQLAMHAAPWFLFDDNNTDNTRPRNTPRQYYQDSGEVAGYFDTSYAKGITTYFAVAIPNRREFTALMQTQFTAIVQHLRNGYDVVIPDTRPKDLNNGRLKNHNQDVWIYHRLGLKNTQLPVQYLKIIQDQIDILENNAESCRHVLKFQIDESRLSSPVSGTITGAPATAPQIDLPRNTLNVSSLRNDSSRLMDTTQIATPQRRLNFDMSHLNTTQMSDDNNLRRRAHFTQQSPPSQPLSRIRARREIFPGDNSDLTVQLTKIWTVYGRSLVAGLCFFSYFVAFAIFVDSNGEFTMGSNLFLVIGTVAFGAYIAVFGWQ